jgi:CheY-like chemotaxis protein
MDGITLRKLIREQPQYAGIKLIISSSGGIAFDQQARALGVDAACPKPVVQEKLIRQLVDLLEKRGRAPGAGEAAAAAAGPARNAGEGAKGRYARLLVAEDNPINQRLITTALTQAGFVVDAVSDGVEALHAMQRLPYDLVLMDIRMPVMSGVDATRRIRTMPAPACNTPIIAMTANTLPGDRERYLAAGMNEYVPKPIDFDDLLRKIGMYLDGATPVHPEEREAETEPKHRAGAQPPA